MRRPDEDYDVIVHCFAQRGSSGTGLPTWTIWLGEEKQGERVTLESALELARDVAAERSRPAWLLDETGYPLKPIDHRAANPGSVDRFHDPTYSSIAHQDCTGRGCSGFRAAEEYTWPAARLCVS